jgi:hypothetical protein
VIGEHELRQARLYAAEKLSETGVVLTAEERDAIEVADFGLSRLAETGLQLLVYVNTDRYCAKELVLRPWADVPGAPASTLRGHPRQGGDVPLSQRPRLSLRRGRPHTGSGVHAASGRIHRRARDRAAAGMQHTIPPGTLHWFQAGPEGRGRL